jgi:glutathione-regulated potassium-efflux system protein KefB
MHGSTLEIALVFLLAAVVAAPLFRRFGLGAVLGYLAAGALLGPQALGVVRDAEPVLAASEVGVVMMLFVLGLELSPSRLKVMRRPVFGVGGAQMLACSLALTLGARMVGLTWSAAAVVGIALALSSTAVGLQLLSERRAVHSEHGRLAFAVLLFQDLAAIPLLAAVPLLGRGGGDGLDALAVAKAIGALAVVVVGGRLLLRQVFRLVARTRMPEVFTGAALLAVLGAAWIMQGAGLSAGLGAFLAGVLLADSEFRHELEAQIEPFKGLLLGLFFMAVGMSIDLARVAAEPAAMLALVTGLMAIKALLIVAVGRTVGRLGIADALQLAAVLALGGEFAFVIFAEAGRAGLIDAALRDRLVAAVGLSMAVTPLLLAVLSRMLSKRRAPERAFDTLPDGQPQVLIAGFGRFGQVVARMLSAQRLPFIAIEPSADQVDFVRRFGNPVYYGDASRSDLLRSAGAQDVRVFVVALEDPEASVRTARAIRQHYPEATVYASARDRRHAWELMDLGVHAIREAFHSSLHTGERVLVDLGLDPATVAEHARRFREHDERLLAAQYQLRDDEDALVQSARYARRELEELFNADQGAGVLGGIAREPGDAPPRRQPVA